MRRNKKKSMESVTEIATAKGTGTLVSTKWLADHKDDLNLVLVDARKTPEYLKDHIPGAVSSSFSSEDYMSYGIDTSYGGKDLLIDPKACLPWHAGPPQYMQTVMRNLGINNDSTVVIYDEGASFYATMFYFELTYHGHKSAYILNGGFSKWVSEGYPVTKKDPKAKTGNFEARIVDPSMIVDTDYVLTNLFKEDTILVFAVDSKWFYGEYLAYNRPGHIPNSILAPRQDLFQKNAMWKLHDVLTRQYAAQGVLPEKEVIVYCGGNPASTSAWFTLHHVLGYPNVKIYYDAILGWLRDKRDLPMHTYQNESLIRGPLWVNWWAGTRIQSLLRDPGTIVVDVRPEENYKAGHIAYAVNIPVLDLIDRKLTLMDWEKLLGQKGIGRHKEVIVYDEQKNDTASLMFWLLEYMGQPKVSIMEGGLAEWSRLNLELTKEEPVIAYPKTKFDIAISPENFVMTLHKEKCLADQKEGPDFFGFPRIWILSSEEIPANGVPVADYKHIPWIQNLSKEGNLKSAANLIKVYEEANVLKYAEIVCYSNSIKDATMTYYALRTLGYPRIRVYVPASEL